MASAAPAVIRTSSGVQDAVQVGLIDDALAKGGQAEEAGPVPVERQLGVEVGKEVLQAGRTGEGKADEALGRVAGGGFEKVVEELVDGDFHGRAATNFVAIRAGRSAHIAALVQDDDVAGGDVPCGRDQEADPGGDFLWLHCVTMRHGADRFRASTSSVSTLNKRRFGHRRRDRVHRDLFAGITAGEVLGQRVHRGLGGAVMRGVEDVEVVGAVRRNVDDLPHPRPARPWP